MAYKSFGDWLIKEQFKDIFGFDKEINNINIKKYTGAIDPLKSEIILDELQRHDLGIKTPKRTWHDVVEWGSGNGSIKIDVSPLGSYKAIARKQITDLEGNKTWICKKAFPFNEHEHNNKELDVADNIFNTLQKIDEQMLDSPSHDYKNLEALVSRTATQVKRYMPSIFVFEGIKKMSDKEYIIYMSYRGAGAGDPNSRAALQFDINMSYDNKSGLIRSFGHEISNPIHDNSWKIEIAEWDEKFCPSQPMDEIVNCIVDILKTY